MSVCKSVCVCVVGYNGIVLLLVASGFLSVYMCRHRYNKQFRDNSK